MPHRGAFVCRDHAQAGWLLVFTDHALELEGRLLLIGTDHASLGTFLNVGALRFAITALSSRKFVPLVALRGTDID